MSSRRLASDIEGAAHFDCGTHSAFKTTSPPLPRIDELRLSVDPFGERARTEKLADLERLSRTPLIDDDLELLTQLLRIK